METQDAVHGPDAHTASEQQNPRYKRIIRGAFNVQYIIIIV